MKKNCLTPVLLFMCLLMSGQLALSQIPAGPFLGQPAPGGVPELFATGLLPQYTGSFTFTADGLECFATKWYPETFSILMTTREQGGIWPDFDTASFSIDMDECPSFTPDGNRLYFISHKPVPPSPYYIRHLWYADRSGSGWADPVMLDSPVNEHFIVSVSVAASGNMYLSLSDDDKPGIYNSVMVGGIYQGPQKLSDSINYLHRPMRPYIAPDESYMLFDASETEDPFSQRDLAISYRKNDGTWTRAVFLDSTVNTSASEGTPCVSGNNHFLFFQRNMDILWMEASGLLTGFDEQPKAGHMAQLNQNYPNPFSETTTIEYSLDHPGCIQLSIYNVLSRQVFVLADACTTAGRHSVTLKAGELSAGVYECVLVTKDAVFARKMVCVR